MWPEPFDQSTARLVAVGAHRYHETIDFTRELDWLVAAIPSACEHALSIRDENERRTPLPSITSREHSDGNLSRQEVPRDNFYERRLAAPAHREVANTHDRNAELFRLDAIVIAVTERDTRGVNP